MLIQLFLSSEHSEPKLRFGINLCKFPSVFPSSITKSKLKSRILSFQAYSGIGLDILLYSTNKDVIDF